ncbi:aminotransferase class V-fold PLP-dependent enzyme [Bradyrhizobium sacchari]|uniref:aminotransferase class V-fold PLP-dependent enzyme n=1 Tax=Bradyrhizobium sacchari TaxID=1399419 RepID=UPI0032217CD8
MRAILTGRNAPSFARCPIHASRQRWGNIVPWHLRRERLGAVITRAAADDDANFLLDDFERLLSPRSTMVAIIQMSNCSVPCCR